MNSRTLSGWLAAALLLACCASAAAADDFTLQRVFLTDGSTLVSYGEPARIGDRVVFSMPPPPRPPTRRCTWWTLQPRVWIGSGRTAIRRLRERLTTSAHKLRSSTPALSIRMTDALNQLTATEDNGRRLLIAENARKMLAAWPQAHYNYRLTEVQQMLLLLDEAIADLRAAAGDGRFDLSLAAFADPPPAP